MIASECPVMHTLFRHSFRFLAVGALGSPIEVTFTVNVTGLG